MKQDFITVSTAFALNTLDKNGNPCAGAYVLHILFPDKYPDPAVYREIAAIDAECKAAGQRTPEAFAFRLH